jgi:hypothetical protein
MSGVSPEHDAIEGNVYHRLRQRLEGRNCRASLANMRIKVPGAPPYRYADLSAWCGQPLYETIGGLKIPDQSLAAYRNSFGIDRGL